MWQDFFVSLPHFYSCLKRLFYVCFLDCMDWPLFFVIVLQSVVVFGMTKVWSRSTTKNKNQTKPMALQQCPVIEGCSYYETLLSLPRNHYFTLHVKLWIVKNSKFNATLKSDTNKKQKNSMQHIMRLSDTRAVPIEALLYINNLQKMHG